MTFTPLATAVAAATTSDASTLSGIAGWAVDVMEKLGGVGIALLIAIENLFPPLPSEVILPLAGFTASQGTKFTLVGAILWATVGSLFGAIALYAIARVFGRERTRAFMAKIPLFKTSDIDKTEAFFDAHNRSTVFFGRMIPIFRSLISLPAGVIKMNFPLFLAFTAVGSAIWNTVLIAAGYALGENWTLVEQYVGVLSKIVLLVIVVAAVVWVVFRLRQNRREAATSDTTSPQ